MWTWTRMPLYLAALTCLLAGATAYYNERYQTFLRKHHDYPKTNIDSADYCAIMMNYRGLHRACKPFNIFIHTSEAHLQEVCGAGGYPYHGVGKRRSKAAYPITVCRLGIVTRTGQCIYYTTSGTRHLAVRCDENRFPVYIDEVLTMSGVNAERPLRVNARRTLAGLSTDTTLPLK